MDQFRESIEQMRATTEGLDQLVKRLTALPPQPEFAIIVPHEVTDHVNFIKCDDGGLYIQMTTDELKLSPDQAQEIVRQLVEWYEPSCRDAAAAVQKAMGTAREAARIRVPERLFAERIGEAENDAQ